MALNLQNILELMKNFRNPVSQTGRNLAAYNPVSVRTLTYTGWIGTKSLMFKAEVESESKDPNRRLVNLIFYGLDTGTQQTSKTPFRIKIDDEFYYFALPTRTTRCALRCSCFTGDTLIPLADGYSVRIDSLVGQDCFYVYSFDKHLNKVVIGKGYNAKKTGTKKVYKITFDNGNFITCTDDHEFLLKTGEYKKVKDIKNFESLESLYRTLFDVRKNKNYWYEQVYQPDGTLDYTHKLADNFNIANKRKYNIGYILLEKVKTQGDIRIRHHIDYNPRNNNPNNLIGMRFANHGKLHTVNNCMKNPETVARVVETKTQTGEWVNVSKRMKINNPMFDKKSLNHKIVSVEYTGEKDVYCFSVEKYENYAIDTDNGKDMSSGVFVHNCPDAFFRWGYYLHQNGSWIGEAPKYVRKTTTWPSVNPKHVPGVCKHMWALIKSLENAKVVL